MQRDSKKYQNTVTKKCPVNVERLSFKYTDIDLSDDRWSDLEMSLSIRYLDCVYDALIDYHPNVKDNNDFRWHNIEIDLDESTKFVNDFTGRYFVEWLMNVDVSVTDKSILLDEESFFINFNYTNTLENLYHISSDRVYHIHGCLDTIRDISSRYDIDDDKNYNYLIRKNIQFGSIYNEYYRIEEELDHLYQDDEYFETAIKPGILHIAEFCRASYKDIGKNYSLLKGILEGNSFEEVIVMGHSITGIDAEYYDNLFVPYLNKCKWTFYCHRKEDERTVEAFTKDKSLTNFHIEEW